MNDVLMFHISSGSYRVLDIDYAYQALTLHDPHMSTCDNIVLGGRGNGFAVEQWRAPYFNPMTDNVFMLIGMGCEEYYDCPAWRMVGHKTLGSGYGSGPPECCAVAFESIKAINLSRLQCEGYSSAYSLAPLRVDGLVGGPMGYEIYDIYGNVGDEQPVLREGRIDGTLLIYFMFLLRQVKIQDVIAQLDLDYAIEGFYEKPVTQWTNEEKRKDRKALSQKSLTNKLHLKHRLYLLKLAEGLSLEEHLIVFKITVSDLETLKVKYDQEDLGLILLCSLSPSYLSFRYTILYSHETLTLQEVYNDLHSFDEMKHLVSGSELQTDCLVMHESTSSDSGRKGEFYSNNIGRGRSKYSN
ncbi:Tryptophan biosynthesis 1 [Hibiscus syriacus]|uniref:Tryptophan biosynthesis 1 n=1 Tax=Hibiscus syriacus TaxID=106335 RepID=A0A6A3B878_HIBSY|nr:Tryptophan biosynthesis 1 [Hibiscus syriacus]